MEGKRSNAVFCRKNCQGISYRKDNAEIIAERKREYYKANAERNREYYKANAERKREYYKANAEWRREYRKANAENIAAYMSEYGKANAEQIAERKREYENNRAASASTLHLAHTINQIKGDLTNGTYKPE